MFNGREIILPWPHRDLSPNARVHPLAKARVFKRAKADAQVLAMMAGIRPPQEGTIVLTIGFHPPSRRRYDLDNAFGALKAACDGIAAAMGVDDVRFGFVLSREDPVKEGKVIVSVSWAEAA